MKPKLEVDIGGLKLKNPVMVASGTFGYGGEFRDYVDPSKLGAIVTKTITRHRRDGNRPPRVTETAAGMLNSIGLQNNGLDDFIENKLKNYKNLGAKLIVSIGGETDDEYAEMAKALSSFKEVAALELNISCPNIEYKDKIIAQDRDLTLRLVKAVRRVTSLPLIVKLSPNVCDITRIAKAAQDGGADAISLINTLLGMAIDVDKRKPVLGNITGGLSGPAIKPIALRMVWQVHNMVSVPVIGMGGIMNARDAIEFIIAGASAVAIGTANFVNPGVSLEVLEGISSYLEEQNFKDVNELIGSLNVS
ncbi:MAG: dihydroorotate dehydrogenase B catalytic subunit [Candidatus Omnitrophica bacterium CG1_02_44_16]|nr:MAG: dihydroorotate dehydrogenase B catalytic subunit [Candidatus Omnitrophica bacterium CG1_02_44_16]PIY82887.1 MAG: dihydroorotate dehydrogenase [Candidatus Omnitrophica bacterium CG_4_10_14_0_8_um_filter_44_12]PIZ83909.1 MAG: dihydroorotate dehydrogenase [Candidatus Omnitrophica bacterium CG_4_10_14_0_2_um_filter_44_9]